MEAARVGPGITVKGDLVGEGDIVVEGRVEGRVELDSHLTIAQPGAVRATVSVRALTVLGALEGDVVARERIEIGATGTVQGDLRAPIVVLADGAVYRGRIDMDVDLGTELPR